MAVHSITLRYHSGDDPVDASFGIAGDVEQILNLKVEAASEMEVPLVINPEKLKAMIFSADGDVSIAEENGAFDLMHLCHTRPVVWFEGGETMCPICEKTETLIINNLENRDVTIKIRVLEDEE